MHSAAPSGSGGADLVVGTVDLSAPRVTFPVMVPLMGLAPYRPALVMGFLISIGGLTESTARGAWEALQAYIWASEQPAPSATDLPPVRSAHPRSPVHKATRLASPPPSFPTDFVRVLRGQLQMPPPSGLPGRWVWGGSIHKANAAIPLLGVLVGYPDPTRAEALGLLLQLLCHKYPTVRRETALQLAGVLDEMSDEAADILTVDTNWTSPDKALLKTRQQRLIQLLLNPAPAAPPAPTCTQ
ncbi:hypothetical protein PAPYR_6256 [Paratrimastix pyriformis]|uniref:Tubulin-folding cofactor D C-terminal domain-containing protein n=1 Tax=Paratrimastix pyriformis TaxID=342808 RepID=A0ABQ8UKX3_9EUKA|nr:hypothetical protein PAPYR_6256 [Paratrimastix pyriformis]